MSDLCVCMRDVISEFNSEIDGSLAFCALVLFLCSILCLMCSGMKIHHQHRRVIKPSFSIILRMVFIHHLT